MMRWIIFGILIFSLNTGLVFAQDILAIHGQPNWKKPLDIADNCFFYEEKMHKPLTFEEAKKQKFVPYKNELRKQRFTNRPLIIQWLRFSVYNSSAVDTLDVGLSTVHVFTRLYAENQLLARSGAYEARAEHDKVTAALDRGRLAVIVPPLTTRTFWLRTEDRQNQLIPPQIWLETRLVSLQEEVVSVFGARYLFLILACMTGCFLFIGIYAAYHYYLYQNKSFVWYILYTIASFFLGLHWMDIRLGMYMFSPLVHDVIFSVFLYLIPVLYSLFIGNMLEFPVYFKKGWLIVKVLLVICLLQMLLEFMEVRFSWFPFPDYYGYFLSPFSIILLNTVLSILTALSKNPVKWFLFVGPVSLIILWCMPVLNLYAPSTDMNLELFLVINFPVVFLLLGLLIEGICFSFALSYQSKLVLVEKNKIQQQYGVELENALKKRTIELEDKNKVVEAQKIEQIETVFAQKIAETEMTALRAQMNPHFIFNCLNSIKLYTLENESQTASDYLTKFSQLIRLVLENSRSEKITLHKELETLTLYIELEAMRFKEKVRYQIHLSPEIDSHYIEIPPLLLQPYVENAIWHGLMHRSEGGMISIEVSQPTDALLHIEITDNGVGREKAGEHKSKSATKQKSFGLQMTSDRIHLINQLYQINTEVQIIDLKDADNKAIGTRVIIEIPI